MMFKCWKWLRVGLTTLVVLVLASVVLLARVEGGKPAPPPPPPPVQYTMQVLDVPAESYDCNVSGMNNRGDVVGWINPVQDMHLPIVWWALPVPAGAQPQWGPPDDLSGTLTELLNDLWGTNVPYGIHYSESGDTRTVLWFNAYGINDDGQVAGIVIYSHFTWSDGTWERDDFEQTAFRYTPGPVELLELPLFTPSDAPSIGFATINNWGDVLMRGSSASFVWEPSGEITPIPAGPGTSLGPCAINDAGQVTGSITVNGEQHAFLFTPGIGTVDLGVLGTSKSGTRRSYGLAINASGQVAGFTTVNKLDGLHAFRHTAGVGTTDLGTLPPSGTFSVVSVSGIDANGHVIGKAKNNDLTRQFLSTPTGLVYLFSLIANATDLGVTASEFDGYYGNDSVAAKATNGYAGHTFGQISGRLSGMRPYVLTPNN